MGDIVLELIDLRDLKAIIAPRAFHNVNINNIVRSRPAPCIVPSTCMHLQRFGSSAHARTSPAAGLDWRAVRFASSNP